MGSAPLWLLAAAAAVAAISLVVLAAVLIAHLAEERDLAARLQSVTRPSAEQRVKRRMGNASAMLRPVLRLGEVIRDSALISEKEVSEFQRAVAAAGLDPRQAVPVFLGAKALFLVAAPLGGIFLAVTLDMEVIQGGFVTLVSVALAIFLPNTLMGWLRKPFHQRLRRGLPDALDLLVVAAEAGLGLETSIERVAREMERSNRAISIEMNLLVQEMRMLPDRRTALERMGERTGIEGFKRLGGTLSQTLRFGTPLAQALRVLAAEMRQERMLRIEEKAIRLPALLVGPLILFILPALFIALIGPSILEMGKFLDAGP
jgi:tight adherence protein C